MDAANNAAAANIKRRVAAKMWAFRLPLLTGSLPPAAAWYARRCAIPFSRSGIAADLTVCISAVDRNPHCSFSSNAAGYVGARRTNLTVGDAQGRVGRWFTGARLGHDCDIPKPVIGRFGSGGSSGKGSSKGKKDNANPATEHETDSSIDDAWAVFKANVSKMC
jgi:hypothetical protein